MSRFTSIALVVGVLVLLSSVAHAVPIWFSAYTSPSLGWGVGTSTPGGTVTAGMFMYDPAEHGGAPLLAVRLEVTSDVTEEGYAAGSMSDTEWADVTATIASSLEVMDPTDPSTVLMHVDHTWSPIVPSLAPGVVPVGQEHTQAAVSAFGTPTGNLASFVGPSSSLIYFPVTLVDNSSWSGTPTAYFRYISEGYMNLAAYYQYDDGTDPPDPQTPEPGTLVLLAAGLPALGLLRRKRVTA